MKQTGVLQAVHDIGDAARMDHEPWAHLAQRHLSVAREGNKHERLIASERQIKLSECVVNGATDDLLGLS